MLIKCLLSVSPENIGYYARQFWESISLPEYVTKMGPYVIEPQEKGSQIMTIYEFDRSKFMEAGEYISEQINVSRVTPESSLSVSILDAGREMKWYQISLNRDAPSAGVFSRAQRACPPQGYQRMT